MVTTHLGDLKTYAFNNERTENAAVEFDIESLRPTYRLHLGQFGMSNALKIARRLRLPKHLLRRAHHYLRKKQRRAPELAKIQAIRLEAEKARQEALEAQRRAKHEEEEFKQKMREIDKEAAKQEALAAARAALKPGDPVRVVGFDKTGSIVRIDSRRGLIVVKAGLGQWEVPVTDVTPLDLA